jgi:Ca-activated chloride channel family protein
MGTHLVRTVVTATLITAPALAVAQTTPFRAGVDLVRVGVTVLDDDGRCITDLKPGEFEVYEDGARQEIAFFSGGREEATVDLDETQRMRLGLLFDTSGSMNNDIKLARSAAIKFLNTFPRAMDITLVDFDTEVRVARYGQADFPRLVERIRERKPDGWTALYDALGAYLDGSFEQLGRKVLVLYTDGGDTRSAVTFSEAMEMLRAADVTVYVIGFVENQSPSVRNAQRMQLMQLAGATGGEAFFPMSPEKLDGIFDRVASQIHAQYNLGYASTNAQQDGKWRRLEVRLVGPRAKGLKVRARPGYYASLVPRRIATTSQETP